MSAYTRSFYSSPPPFFSLYFTSSFMCINNIHVVHPAFFSSLFIFLWFFFHSHIHSTRLIIVYFAAIFNNNNNTSHRIYFRERHIYRFQCNLFNKFNFSSSLYFFFYILWTDCSWNYFFLYAHKPYKAL